MHFKEVSKLEENSTAIELVELTTLNIDCTLSVKERKKEFLKQIKNPGHFLVDGIEVEVNFSSDSLTLKNCLEKYLKN